MSEESKKEVGGTWSAGKNCNQNRQDFKLSQSCFEQKISEDGLSCPDIHFESNRPIKKVMFSCGKDGITKAWLQFLKKENYELVSKKIDQSRLCSRESVFFQKKRSWCRKSWQHVRRNSCLSTSFAVAVPILCHIRILRSFIQSIWNTHIGGRSAKPISEGV